MREGEGEAGEAWRKDYLYSDNQVYSSGKRKEGRKSPSEGTGGILRFGEGNITSLVYVLGPA